MRKAFKSTLMVIVGLLGIIHFTEMIGLLIQGKEVDPITLYIILASCVVASIKVVIESVLNWIDAFRGTTEQAIKASKALTPEDNKIVN